jgi:hypothetical protein
VRFPQSLKEIDRDTLRKMYGVAMRCLDSREHFGGALAVEVHHAMLDAHKYLESVITLDTTIEFLDALATRRRALKIEGKVITTWKVNDEGDQA